VQHADPEQFRLQLRDLWVAPSDVGFWQAAIRDSSDPDYRWLARSVTDRTPFTVEILYGDNDGGQRTISRFAMIPFSSPDVCRWYPTVSRHWSLDRPDPR
jgi:hypothetical protein